MEFKLEYLYKMPLKDLAARRVAILLCSLPKMYEFAANMKNESKSTYEMAIDDVLSDILATISLPVSTKKELVSIMKPVSREVIKWINFHEGFLELENKVLSNLDVLEHIRWTRLGTVKYQETAEALIGYQKLSVELRYKLACLYCFDEEIRDLWKKIPVWSKKHFYSENPLFVTQSKLVVIWTYIIKNRINELVVFLTQERRRYHSIYQYAFEYAASHGYSAATQFFFERLTSQEIRESLVRTAFCVARMRSFDFFTCLNEYQKFTEVLFYLLSQMPEFELRDLYYNLPFETLKCFLDWPRQESFIEHAKYVFEWCNTLTEEEYCRLLYILTRNISSGYHYPKLYQTFFLISPKKFKDYALTRYTFFLREFVRIGDDETIKFVFRHVNHEEKMQLAFGLMKIWFGPKLLLAQWSLIELIIHEAELAKDNKVKMVVSFLGQIPVNQRCHLSGKLVNEIDEDKNASNCDKSAQSLLLSAMKPPDFENTERPFKMQKKA